MKCFYHMDIDGKCSGAIVNRFYQDKKIEFIPVDYHIYFPFDSIEKNEEIIIVDFSLQKPGEFKKLREITENIIWIDHHKTAIERHTDMEDLRGDRDVSKAGCELTWEYFYTDRDMPLAVKYAGRYDVWDFSEYGENLNIFQMGIRLFPNEPHDPVWKLLLQSDVHLDRIMKDGEITLKYRNNFYASQIKSWAFFTVFEGYKAVCCNIGSVSFQLFDSVTEDYDLMIPFVYDGKQWTISLYTKKDIDCSEIAKKFGGGGHKQAAGFQCYTLPWQL